MAALMASGGSSGGKSNPWLVTLAVMIATFVMTVLPVFYQTLLGYSATRERSRCLRGD
jgi:hypothetical protein